MAQAREPGFRPSSVERTLPVLKALAEYPNGVALESLARKLGTPKSTLHRALNALCGIGFAEQDADSRYRLGLEFIRVAFMYHERRDDRVIVQPLLDALAARFQANASFARLHGGEVVYVATAERPGSLQVAVRAGDRGPAHGTALGKALLAAQLPDAHAVSTYLSYYGGAGWIGPLTRFTHKTKVSVAELTSELDDVREEGYALEDEEAESGLVGLAFPIFLDSPTSPTGAVGLTAVVSQTSFATLRAAASAVRTLIEEHLGASSTTLGEQEPRRGVSVLPAAVAERPPTPLSVGKLERQVIASIEPIVVHAGVWNWSFVRVTTADGIVGYGEASTEGDPATVLSTLNHLRDQIVGEDASRIHHVWQLMYKMNWRVGGREILSAISGIEQALWDIRARSLAVPVVDLLGGACRDRVLLYATGVRGSTPEEVGASARAIADQGFTAMKMTTPVQSTLSADSERSLDGAVELVRAARDAIGPEPKLALDLRGRLTPAMAVRFARLVEDCDIWFIEEPAPPENPRAVAEVARSTTIPIATGERLYTRWGFRELIEERAVAMIQPNIVHCGGIFESRVIAAMAETHYLGVAPHNPFGPVSMVASAQLALAIPNLVALEYVIDDVPWRDEIVRGHLTIKDGYLELPRIPGLGLELDWGACNEHPYQPQLHPTLRQEDGSLADW